MLPRKSDTMAINNKLLDRRVKLTEEDRVAIIKEYSEGNTSYNKLAKKYKVSKKLIFLIVNPEKQAIAKEQYKERRKDGRYYNKEEHTKAIREHREYKKKLYEEGKLKG